MREVILNSLISRMRVDNSIFFVTADMGINLVERIEEEFPTRFLNVGIAEQNAIGVAAGLANMGYRPWVYSISNFLVHRCFEQLRNDVVLHNYPVTLLGTSTGYDNAALGPTHHIIDDWGLVAGMPGTSVFAPSTIEFAETLVDRVLTRGGLHYVRVAKGSPSIPGSERDEVTFLGNGDASQTLVVSYGGLGARLALDKKLMERCALALVHKVSPLPESLESALKREPGIVVVAEDQVERLGISAEIALLIARKKLRTQLLTCSPNRYDLMVGTTPIEYERRVGLDPQSILTILEDVLY